jgi:Fe-S-cluster-containing hydrogenase component 2
VRALTEPEAVHEAGRCLDCGCGEGCGLCARICSDFAIHLEAPDTWSIHEDECVACGMCFNRCPNGNIAMIERVGVH